ncbi:MAG TPA: LuxR C-terminal-related transcriptional regulator [Actinospica sp.]|jgi:DNA-binding CsgD family transcriptional regulator|nr:LuxR C-terminal-related transcriptional regulator [Actinospica sp.]
MTVHTVWPLVGREHEMSVLRGALADCADGASTAIELTGDPGLGKSRLLRELAEAGHAGGLTVLAGRATEFDRARSPDDEIATLLTLATSADHGHGVLLCLDDLHWADERTVQRLHVLLRRPPATPLILAYSHRPRQASARLLASLHHAATHYRTTRLPLPPLDRQACRTLIRARHEPARREQLCAMSGGNPLYLQVLCELGIDDATGFAELPDTLRATLARETALLTEAELTVLRAAAVLGDPFDPMLLTPVSGLAEESALAALDVLAQADLVRVCRPSGARPDSRRLLRFRHPLLREVVSEETPPGWRLLANARADRALCEAGAGIVERAPHVARTARVGDTEAVRLLIEAAARTAHTAPATAAAWQLAALRLSAPNGSRETNRGRLGLLLGLADAYGVTGDLAACRDALGQALDLVPPDQPEQRVPVVVLRSVVERILGSVTTAERVLEAELELWPTTDKRADPLRLQLATNRMGQGRFDEADALLDALHVRTRGSEDRRVTVSTAACRSLGAAYSGRIKPLRTHSAEASSAFDVMPDDELATFLDELGQLGWAEVLAEQHRDAIRHMSRGVRIARQTGQRHVALYLLLCQSYAQHATGDLTNAIASASGAEEAAYLLDRPDLVAYALTLRAASTSLQVNPAAAAGAAERGLRALARPGSGRLRELAAAVLASVRLDQGRPEDCLELLRSICGVDRSVATHALRATWYCVGAQAEMARGDVAAAQDWADAAVEAAEAMPLPGQRGYAHLAMGCRVGEEDPAHAVELFSAAADSFGAAGLVLVESRALLQLGRALSATGRPDEATTVIGRAKQIADAHGAAFLASLATNTQRRIGARRPRRDPTGGALSEQERRISAMVASGLSNRDIAAGLFVSVKTVEAHLTRIFRKLGVTSRSGLVSALSQSSG